MSEIRCPSVQIDHTRCLAEKGCRTCIDACPLDALKVDADGKVRMARDECWFCLPCEQDCPTKAIHVDLPYLLR